MSRLGIGKPCEKGVKRCASSAPNTNQEGGGAGDGRQGSSRGAVLIVDDNAEDAAWARRAILRLDIRNPVITVSSGAAAIAYIKGEVPYQDRQLFPYPVLILLDLKMPGIDGFEVLRWLQRESTHGALPVVALSAIEDLRLVTRAYQLGARSFLRKPITTSDFEAFLRAFGVPVEF